jgi:hypothetical protein
MIQVLPTDNQHDASDYYGSDGPTIAHITPSYNIGRHRGASTANSAGAAFLQS